LNLDLEYSIIWREGGLRQGEPLSPFLFLLVAEDVNVMMKTMVENGLFTGYKVGA